ncbi:MAG TPA: hypothetical protein VF507_00630, partial [Pyrinomonadaceae bacterium]
MKIIRVRSLSDSAKRLLLSPLLLLAFCSSHATAASDEGINVDLPAGGEIRVENRRGGVAVEVWKERYVSVSVTVEGGNWPLRTPPVSVQRSEHLLTVRVPSPEINPPTRVDLTLRIPERSRAEIVTAGGAVEVTGLPATLSVRTLGGDIRARFPANADAEINAEAVGGRVDSRLEAGASSAPRSDERTFQARLGAGGKIVRLRTERGNILLAPVSEISGGAASTLSGNTSTNQRTAEGTDGARKAPTLNGPGASNGGGAGTPAPAPSSTPQEVDEGDVVRVDTELVTLNMSVVDRQSSRGLTGLRQADF